MAIAQSIHSIQEHIGQYEQRYGRPAHSVKLLAVCKGQHVESIFAAFAAGLRDFAESYLQEALSHQQALADQPIAWHFIGPIQSNKTRAIAEQFSWVHSVASLKIATRLSEQRPSSLSPLNICLQVNISEEATKSGLRASEVFALATACSTLPNLSLRGLMAIPAPYPDFTRQRQEFKKLAILYHELQAAGFALDTLSMGMSSDYEAAIAEGATMVRIGKSLFNSKA